MSPIVTRDYGVYMVLDLGYILVSNYTYHSMSKLVF